MEKEILTERTRCMDHRAIAVRGIVQGVRLRPYVSHLASERNLSGFVRNRQVPAGDRGLCLG